MCGILVQWSWAAPLNTRQFEQALHQLHHRGPDGRGVWSSADQQLLFGHTRLSISGAQNGRQPLSTPNGSLVAVVNGELYGYQTLRRDLEARGHHFQTRSDSELVLHLYAEYGESLFEHLRGEFAFVLWDHAQKRLLAARDRFGTKPLYYHLTQEGIIFASEAKAIWEAGLTPQWDTDSLWHVFSMQYSPAQRSLFKEISQIQAGEYLLIKPEGVQHHTYWKPITPITKDIAHSEAKEQLRAHLFEAVALRLDTELPVCTHLSGGVDSSGLLGLMSQYRPAPLDVFTVAFEGGLESELALARATAQYHGAHLHEVHLSANTLIAETERAIYHTEGLTINGHMAAKHLLNKTLNEKGYKVVLTGEGADELFLGYPHFQADMGEPISESQSHLKGIMLPSGTPPTLSCVQKALGFVPTWLSAKAMMGKRFQELLSHDFLATFEKRHFFEEWIEAQPTNTLKEMPLVRASAALWSKYALGNYILNTVGERLDMMHGIEARLPFLDHVLFEFSQGIPASALIRQGQTKVLFRQALMPYLLPQVYQAVKQPFVGPPLSAHPAFSKLLCTLPFPEYIQRNKVLKLLKDLPQKSPSEQQSWDPVLMQVLSLCALQQHFGLGLS